ncbi:MAG: hypothetical protein U0350_00870 [Caldilineaceae bacterium]
MITYDLGERSITLDELLKMASEDAIQIIGRDGNEFILAQADTFEQEVAKLGNSVPFMQFLANRAQQRKGRSLEEVEQTLNQRLKKKQ